MKKEILITLLCAGLMLVTPFTTIAQENKVSSNLKDEPDDVEGLVAQIRTVVDEILQKYGHIPMVRSISDLILILLGLFGLIIFCIFSISIVALIGIIAMILALLRFYDIPLFLMAFLLHLITELEHYCNPLYPPFSLKLPFKSLYTMLETKDNINTFDCCPCLEE